MSKYHFTEDQIKRLSESKWVKKVTESSVQFTIEFKKAYLQKIEYECSPSEALLQFGIDPKDLGPERVKALSARVRQFSKRQEGFERKENSSKGKKRKLQFDSVEAKAAYYEEYSKKLEQELEFAKKIRALEEKYHNSARAKNSK